MIVRSREISVVRFLILTRLGVFIIWLSYCLLLLLLFLTFSALVANPKLYMAESLRAWVSRIQPMGVLVNEV